ncbi:MAG: hypothetical protein M1828_002645 [Chrysothrix sp. TS-e1954]|nr:MAG: hypothetical protein M1828_002645 [Chrysothrix sp. TS-e1954]
MPPLAPPSEAVSKKRKQPHSSSQASTQSFRQKKRTRLVDARNISTQTTDTALKDGELDVVKFVRARDFEVRALEDGMRRSKHALTTRAFQEVPRDLRRRTASHNAKRVPKRLRNRAKREMVEDNTPSIKRKPTSHQRLRLETIARLKKLSAKTKASKATKRAERATTTETAPLKVPHVKKNVLQDPPCPKARFRKRQIHKLWLPTHVFHAKRAHMTPPKEPLWRLAIPLTPTNKSYRATHRASGARGAIAWDKSYMSTISLEGPIKSLQGALAALGVGIGSSIFWSSKSTERWVKGTRFWEGWAYERDCYPTRSIAPITVIWCTPQQHAQDADSNKSNTEPPARRRRDKRQLMIRVHPSAFLHLWEELIRVCKVQKPSVTLEDLRFEIGSIEVTGPSATEALVKTLWPSPPPDNAKEHAQGSPESIWSALNSLSDSSSLPSNALLSFDASDPRLHYPPRAAKPSTNDSVAQVELLRVLVEWPIDRLQAPQKLFSPGSRLAAQRMLPAQKSVNRRKTDASPGAYPEPKATDPRIPVILLANRTATPTYFSAPNTKRGSPSGSWTLLLPWKCVLPVWYCLVHQPLSTGEQPRFGGLDETRQLVFEQGGAWFPCDYPGTTAGQVWEMQQREKRWQEWARRPKGKRVEFDSLDLSDDEKKRKGEIGLGWACDWNRLLSIRPQTSDEAAEVSPEALKEKQEEPLVQPWQLPYSIAHATCKGSLKENIPPNLPAALATIRLSLLTRGTPTVCARIYRLPIQDGSPRTRWLDLVFNSSNLGSESRKKRKNRLAKPSRDAPAHEHRRYLAASLLDPDLQSFCQESEKNHPPVPGEEDLIGFVTTGGFNLGEGKGSAVGAIVLHKALSFQEKPAEKGEDKAKAIKDPSKGDTRLCIVREAGYALGRLARWSLIQ